MAAGSAQGEVAASRLVPRRRARPPSSTPCRQGSPSLLQRILRRRPPPATSDRMTLEKSSLLDAGCNATSWARDGLEGGEQTTTVPNLSDGGLDEQSHRWISLLGCRAREEARSRDTD